MKPAFGDSQTLATGLTAYHALIWPGQSVNYGKSGAQAADNADDVLAQTVISTFESYLATGVNDAILSCGSTVKLGWFQKIHMALAAHLLIADSDKVYAASSAVTKSTGAQPWFPGFFAGSMYAQDGGASIEFPVNIQNGCVYICAMACDGWTGSTFNVKVDGVEYAAAVSPCSAGNIQTQAPRNRTYAPFLIRIALPGVTGVKAVRMMCDGWAVPPALSRIGFLWAASPKAGPKLSIGNVPYLSTAGWTSYGVTSATVDAVNTIIACNAAQLVTDGLTAQLQDTKSAVNNTTDLQGDGLHGNQSFHNKWAAAWIAPGAAPAPPPSPPAITYTDCLIQKGSDGLRYLNCGGVRELL